MVAPAVAGGDSVQDNCGEHGDRAPGFDRGATDRHRLCVPVGLLDKTFGWHYTTLPAGAWIHGGSPTKGFLASVNAGPFTSIAHSWAGQGWADWMFMLALAGIGLALILGVGLRIAAVAGVLLVAMMWAAVWPLAQHATGGALTSSTNPLMDEHAMDALALIVIGVGGTASRMGLGALWARLPFVQRHQALL